jgi:ABC-type lipoprotein export system ATPase subunit
VPFEREKNESVIGNELGGTNFNIQLFIDRNLDIYKIIQFLLAREKNFLHITGPSGTGKTTIVRIAFHLATERDSHQKFKDGIKLIVCERATSIIQVEAKLR